jgi:hypothetical protein
MGASAMEGQGRLARRVVIGLMAAYAAYLVAANLFLNTPLGEQVANRKPEKFRAGWSAAWSLYPGHVQVRDLRLAGHVRRTVWSVQADEASGRVALLPLLAREIRIPRVVARGASGGATRIDVERPRPEPRPGGWTLRFDDLVVDSARYAYFNRFVLLGDGTARTAFSKVMRGGPMEVLPSTAHFGSARLLGRGEELLREATLDGGFAVARHVSTEAPGIRKLEKMDIEFSLDGRASGLSIVAGPGQRPGARVVRDAGRISGRVGWQRGALRAGSELELAVPVTYDVLGEKDRDIIDAMLEVGEDDIRVAGRLEARPESAFQADLALAIAGREVPVPDWERVIGRSDGELKARWHFDSLAWLSAMLPAARIVSFDGAGTVLADLKIEKGRLAPGSELKVPGVSASVVALGNRFRGDADARVTFAADEPGRVAPRLDAVMKTFRVEPADVSSAPYVEGRNLELEARAEGTLAELRDRFKARLRFTDARVPDLRVYNRYLPQSRLSITGGSGLVSGDMAFDGDEEVGSGVLTVSGKQARLEVAALALQGDIDVTTRLRRGDLRRKDFSIDDSTLALRNVTVAEAGGDVVSDWWLETRLPQAQLEWGRPMKMDGRTTLRMKDLSVLLALFAQKKELPHWVQKLLDEGEANAEGRLRWDGQRLVLDDIKARNDRFDLDARLQLQQKQLSGDLFARWGLLSLGVDLDGGQKDFHLLNARKWFDAQPRLLTD